MSHFTCLVIGQDIEKLLQPFHEFECTGINDQYVQDIDVTEEKREEYAADTEYAVLDPEGKRHWLFTPEGGYDIRFCTEGLHGRKEQRLPPGWTETKVPASERFTFEQWAPKNCGPLVPPDGCLREEHKYGYVRLAEDGTVQQIVDRTNPKKKWDWWQLGGRWNGMLLLKPGASGQQGERGAFDGGHSNKGVSAANKGDVDWEGMRDAAAARALTEYLKVHTLVAGRTWKTWAEVRAENEGVGIQEIREIYWEQPVMADFQASNDFHFLEYDNFRCTEEEYVQRQRDAAICTFAVLKDGVWYERGSMGWWGMVSDEKDKSEWHRQFNELVDSLPDDTLLSVVDCHI